MANMLTKARQKWNAGSDDGLGDLPGSSELKYSPRRRLSLTRIRRTFSRLLVGPLERPVEQRPTAYLDGLRGFAAFLVYWHHHQLWAHDQFDQNPYMMQGFGWRDRYFLATLPVVRNLFTGGHFAVSTFFVISGYALSTNPLRLIHAGEFAKLQASIASALFRRWFRLYVPLAIITIAYMSSWHVGSGIWANSARPQSTFYDELRAWYFEFKNFSFFFNCGGSPWLSYNNHSWSIPVEMRGSVAVYTLLLAFSRSTQTARLLLELVVIVYFIWIADGWYCALFTAGVFLCEMDLLAARGRLPKLVLRLAPFKQKLWHATLVFALVVGGCPSMTREIEDLQSNPGWNQLAFLVPQAVFDYKWFFLLWASTALVAAVAHIPLLRRFFESRVCQRLGRISYALYLVHGPLLWTLGDRLYAAAGWTGPNPDQRMEAIPRWANLFPLSRRGPLGLEPAFLLPHLVLLPVTLIVADLFTTLVDNPTVHFSHKLYRWTLPRAPPYNRWADDAAASAPSPNEWGGYGTQHRHKVWTGSDDNERSGQGKAVEVG